MQSNNEKAVVLAAGEGARMHPLTLETPKPLLKVNNKPLLEHIIEALPDNIGEIFVVVGYLAHKIQNYFGTNWKGRRINYVFQKKKLGTAHALKLCESFIKEREKFLLLYADDLHGKKDLENIFNKNLSFLVSEMPDPKQFGVVILNDDESVKEIIEKPEHPKSNLVSTGAMVLDKKIFDYEADIHSNGEYYLTSALNKMLKDHKIFAVRSNFWFPVGYPEDLKKAEELLKNPFDG